MKNLLYKITLPIQYLLVILFIIFEELIWEQIALPFAKYLSSLRLLQLLQRAIYRTNRYLILIIFLLIFLSVEFAGVIAGVLIVRGMIILGILLYMLKIPIAIFTFWLFNISKDKLLSFTWFKWSYENILNFIEWLKTLYIYQKSMIVANKIKQNLYSIWKKFKDLFPKHGEFFKQLKSIYYKLRNR